MDMMFSMRVVRNAGAAAVVAALLGACQTAGQPPALTAESRLLAAGYVKDPSYPRAATGTMSYEARFSCAPPACPGRASVSYFTSRVRGERDGRTAEEGARAKSGDEFRRGLQFAADMRGSGRRYTSARNVSTADSTGAETSSVSFSSATGRPSFTRSRMTLRGNTMRMVVSNGDTDALARRGLALGAE